MPSPSNRSGIGAATKRTAKKIARNVFGLDVSRARLSPHNPILSGYGFKWISRFMHFERLLQGIAEVEGTIVECGVGPGRSLFDFSAISNAIGRSRPIIAYDTFKGIPDATEVDGKWNAGIAGTWNYSQEQVKENLLTAGLDVEAISRIVFVVGELGTTLPYYDAGPIALLHLDVDLYEHVVQGGVIAFDEYRLEAWPGATQAIDEFFAARLERIDRSPVADRYFTIKCG